MKGGENSGRSATVRKRPFQGTVVRVKAKAKRKPTTVALVVESRTMTPVCSVAVRYRSFPGRPAKSRRDG